MKTKTTVTTKTKTEIVLQFDELANLLRLAGLTIPLDVCLFVTTLCDRDELTGDKLPAHAIVVRWSSTQTTERP